MSARRRSQRGFTLTELMIVVLIVASLSAIVYGLVGTSVGGANAEHLANDITTTMNFARMRAVSTRSYHQVEVFPKKLLVWQAWDCSPAAAPCGAGVGKALTGLKQPTGGTQQWKQVQQVDIPSNNVTIWNAHVAPLTATDISGGGAVTQNAALDVPVYFAADGSSSGGAVFVSDIGKYKQWRILVYTATGSSYARNGF
jgi:prepilin-type N-terminal cleavage/methylation domain-containing protein